MIKMEYNLEFMTLETQMKEVRGLTWNGEDLEVFDFFVCLLWFFCLYV